MHYFLIIAILIVTGVFFAGCSRKAPGGSTGRTTIDVNIPDGQFFSKQDIEKQLEEIKKAPAPENLKIGAMCYVVIEPPKRTDYVCPNCGEKTLYAKISTIDPNENFLWIISEKLYDLEECKKLVKQIEKITIALDESQFCKHCSPDIQEPNLGLIIKYPDSQEVHRVWDINNLDLILLKAFTEGQLKFEPSHDWEWDIKSHISRLEELLGVDIE